MRRLFIKTDSRLSEIITRDWIKTQHMTRQGTHLNEGAGKKFEPGNQKLEKSVHTDDQDLL
jgi:hypothetical protein